MNNVDIKKLNEYCILNMDKMLRLFKDRYVCFISTQDGGVDIDACYNTFEEGEKDADERYGSGNYLLHKVTSPTEREVVHFYNFM